LRNPAHIFCMPVEKLEERNMPFLMAYNSLELFFFPILFSTIFYIADIWLLCNLPFGTTTLSLFLLCFLTGALAMPVVGLWAIKRHGAFVVSADKKGLYYKKMDEDGTLVFINWDTIHNFTIRENSKRTLVIETTFNKFKKDKLPVPCNGAIYFLESGIICLEFNTSCSYKSAHILKNLTNLQRRYFSNKVETAHT
jgi:hypothetical protein